MARNRMIKPEFWEDDKIGECSPTSRLLFIALWNFADDEGYLEYRIKWIKAKCFPYDNLKIEPLIDELVRVGRVEVKSNIIWIKNFLKHQKIEKPKESNLSQIFKDSPTPPRLLPDSSATKREEKGREEKGSKKEIEQVVEEYEKHFGTKILSLTEKRKSQIKSRLESFGLEKVKQAIENFSTSPFHRGDNDRNWKADIDFIIRSDEQIEKGLNLEQKTTQTDGNRQIVQALTKEQYESLHEQN